jgi:RNA polymerase sigma factor (sigma-70 family)
MDKGPDDQILDAIKKKQQIGPSLLVSKYYDALMSAAIELYGIDESDAEECVAMTFHKAIKSITSFELKKPGALRNWLLVILKNTIIDVQRKSKRDFEKLPSSLFNESDLEAFDDDGRLSGVAKGVARVWIQEFDGIQLREDDRKEIIYNIMDSFGADEQADLWSYFKGLCHKEIADMRGASLLGTQKQINRLVQEFFKRIGEKIGIDWRTIYENYKKQNRQDPSGRDAQGQTEDSRGVPS